METTTNLSFHVLDVIGNKGTVEYENLAKMFIESEEDLCMKKMNDGNFQKVINLYEYFIPDVGFLCDYVYCIKQTNFMYDTITAFAFVRNNIEKIYIQLIFYVVIKTKIMCSKGKRRECIFWIEFTRILS